MFHNKVLQVARQKRDSFSL